MTIQVGAPGTAASAAQIQQLQSDLGVLSLVPLVPSGGDDSPTANAMYAAAGRLLLGPGRFKFNTPLRLGGGSLWRAGGTTYYGPTIRGAGKGLTFIDTSGMGLSNHDVAAIDSITIGAATVITSAAITAQGWPDGSAGTKQCIVQMPSARAGVDTAVASVERLNGAKVYLKSLGSNQYQLYHDSALTNAVNSTGWGAGTVANIGNASNQAFIRQYTTVVTSIPYTPAIRIAGTAPAGVGTQLMGCLVEGVTFEASSGSTYGAGYERQGVCLAFESDATNADTTTLQGVIFNDVNIHGYDVACATDDVTNFGAYGCNFQNNTFAVWSGYNSDIFNFDQCRFGDDTVISLWAPLQHVIVPALSYYSPLGVKVANSQDNLTFRDCWFMGVLAVNQNMSANGVVSGANGSAPFASSTRLENCYFEQLRRIGDYGNLVMDSCSLNVCGRDTNLTSNECLIGAFGFGSKARISIRNCFGLGSSATAGACPKYGFIEVRQCGTAASNPEIYTPDIEWSNNRLGYNTSTGCHILEFGGHKIILADDVGSNDQNQAGGTYFFEGTLQTDGRRRINKGLINSAAGTYTPYVLSGNLHHVGPVAAATAIANPCLTSLNATTFAATYGGAANGSAGNPGTYFMHAPIRMLTQQFILEQDATGGRAFSFGTDFVTTTFTSGAAATAWQKSVVEFKWVGTKWVQLYPNVWA